MLVQATAGLRALEGDASDRILQAVSIAICYHVECLEGYGNCVNLKGFQIVYLG